MALPRLFLAVRSCLPSLVGLSRRAVNIARGRPDRRKRSGIEPPP
jgi:hypothetical protein